MTRRSFKVIEVTEILTHWYAGRGVRQLARSLGVDRKTIRKYLSPAIAAGLVPGGPPVTQEQWLAWVREWFPGVVRVVANSDASNEVARFHDRVAAGLKTNTLSTVWQRLRDEEGLGASLSTTRRYVHGAMPQLLDPNAVTVFKEDAAPGEEGQVDYEYLGPWTNPLTGKRHRVFAITSNRAPQDWYALFPNPVVAEGILDRLINSAHHVFMEGRSYRPNKRPGREPALKPPRPREPQVTQDPS